MDRSHLLKDETPEVKPCCSPPQEKRATGFQLVQSEHGQVRQLHLKITGEILLIVLQKSMTLPVFVYSLEPSW